MPIYEYTCNNCNKGFEILQKITEKSKTKCPECGGKLEKIISQSSFHLKGSGWFKAPDSQRDSKKVADSSPCKSPQPCGEASSTISPQKKCSTS